MSTTIAFTIRFHGPFRVGGGDPVDGFDAPVNREDPLPQSSIKGLMRAEALEQLHFTAKWVDQVFGSATQPCPWWWGPVTLTDVGFSPTTNVHVDERGRSQRGFLRFGEQVWATEATFTVEQVKPLSDDELQKHRIILLAAAASVSSLGESRLRGLGWVDITPTNTPGDLAAQTLKLMAEVTS